MLPLKHQGKRKEVVSRSVSTTAPYHDGYQWRKYGEKRITNSKFPRLYYRCTYKDGMNCPGLKHVQQRDDDDPPTFHVVYINNHTCSGSASSEITPEYSAPSVRGEKKDIICFRSQCSRGSRGALSPLQSGRQEEEQSKQQSRSETSLVIAGDEPESRPKKTRYPIICFDYRTSKQTRQADKSDEAEAATPVQEHGRADDKGDYSRVPPNYHIWL